MPGNTDDDQRSHTVTNSARSRGGVLERANVLAFGWSEHMRLGFDAGKNSQTEPRAATALRELAGEITAVSAGASHTLALSSDGRLVVCGRDHREVCTAHTANVPRLVQCSLVAETATVEQAVAGSGASFVLDSDGFVLSWGCGDHGQLGHGDEKDRELPTVIAGLQAERVVQLAAGEYHVLALTDTSLLFAWGSNSHGQLGCHVPVGAKLLTPQVCTFGERETPRNVAAGGYHSAALVNMRRVDNRPETVAFCWGDASRQQLGGADPRRHHFPQEATLMTRLQRRHKTGLVGLACGGWHTVVSTTSGHLAAWGAGDSGQLGNGLQRDQEVPSFVASLNDVVSFAAGARHTIACNGEGELFAWGLNAYGELGLGDREIRLVPHEVTALRRAFVTEVSAGAKHSVVLIRPELLRAHEESILKQYFNIAFEGNDMVKQLIQQDMASKGLDPAVLERRDEVLPGQPGTTDESIPNDRFEPGLRYCMDTFTEDVNDYRRKTYEASYEVPSLGLNTVCMACARRCHARRFVRVGFRARNKGDVCDCVKSKKCLCRWSPIREQVDKIAGDDECIGPNQLRGLLVTLRDPVPVIDHEANEAVYALGDGTEDADVPRIHPSKFERWFMDYFHVTDI